MKTQSQKRIIGMPPELAKALDEKCNAIDAQREFAGKANSETLEDRVLLKLAAFEECCDAHGFPIPMTKAGKVDRNKALNAIRHMAFKTTSRMDEMYVAIGQRRPAPDPFRHVPEQEIDRLIDDYEIVIKDRGYGPLRSVKNPAKASPEGCVIEIGCELWHLDKIARDRLDALVAAYNPGPVQMAQKKKKQGRTAKRVANPAHAQLLATGLASFNGKLPQDPLHPGRADTISIALRSGVGVPDIYESEKLSTMITDAASNAILVDHPLLTERRYTYADLIGWARDVGRLGARSESEAGKEIGAAPAPEEAGPEEITVASRKQVHALRQFIDKFVPDGADTFVPYDFKAKLERAIANHFQDFEHGWRGLVEPWIVLNDQYRATKPLPDNLGLALRILLREVGLGRGSLSKAVGGHAGFWADGLAIPTHKSELAFKGAAELLRVPFATLKTIVQGMFRKRSFSIDRDIYPSASRHLPIDFETLDDVEQSELLERNHWRYVRQGLPYGRRLAYMKADEYAFPRDEWEPELQAAFESTKPPEKKDRSPLRGFDDGARKPHERGKRKKLSEGWRTATSDLREDLLTYIFGYWARPREVENVAPVIKRVAKLKSAIGNAEEQAADSEVPDFVREGGLGIPRELIKPALIALYHLTLQFSYWKTRRSGRYVRTIPEVLKVLAPMLRPESGIIWKSPEMIGDLEAFADWWAANPHETLDRKLTFDIAPFRKNWQKAVKKTYLLLIDDLALASENDIKPSRDSKLPVTVFLDDDNPMERYMVGVKTLLDAKPQAVESQHVHSRDCVQTLILIQTGLRTFNMMLTIDDGKLPTKRWLGRDGKVLEPTLRKELHNGETRWVIRIPSSEFKNWYSPFFKGERPYEKVLADEDDLYRHLETYMTKARPYFLKGRRSEALFVSSLGKDMDEDALALAYKRITGAYFISNPDVHDGGVEGAMVHAMHAVRHVIATHIVKVTGSIHIAAWAIQDAPRTVELHYAKFIPGDKIKHADRILEGARAASRAANSNEAEAIRLSAFMAIAA